MLDNATSLLEILGICCVLIAAFAVDWRLGLATSGVMLTTVGFLLGQIHDEPEQAPQ